MAMVRVDEDDVKLKHPFSMILAGNRRTGKTQFIKRMLLERERFIASPQIEHVIWIYASPQGEVFSELQASMGTRIEFVKGLPTNASINDAILEEKLGSKLIIIDDLMEEASRREDVKHLFTRGRHENVSVVFLSQNLFHKSTHAREMAINTDYLTLFKNPRDASSITYLGRQMGNTKFLQKAFALATREPFSHFFIDMRSDTDDRLRYRSKVLSDYTIVYLPDAA